jgi:hypothetical protein
MPKELSGKAFLAKAATSAESIPPEIPTTTPLAPALLTSSLIQLIK